jgi:hypothetical protein
VLVSLSAGLQGPVPVKSCLDEVVLRMGGKNRTPFGGFGDRCLDQSASPICTCLDMQKGRPMRWSASLERPGCRVRMCTYIGSSLTSDSHLWPAFIGEGSTPRCAKAARSPRSAVKPIVHSVLRYVLTDETSQI